MRNFSIKRKKHFVNSNEPYSITIIFWLKSRIYGSASIRIAAFFSTSSKYLSICDTSLLFFKFHNQDYHIINSSHTQRISYFIFPYLRISQLMFSFLRSSYRTPETIRLQPSHKSPPSVPFLFSSDIYRNPETFLPCMPRVLSF